MPQFRYQAFDQHGAKHEGEIDAGSETLAVKSLQAQGLMVSSLKQQGRDQTVQGLSLSNKVSLQDLEYLTSELSLLLQNGVKIDKGLAILQRNVRPGPTGRLVNDLLNAVRKGQPLSAAMEARDDVFSSLYISLVKLGEASGNLAMIFNRLSRDLRFQRELRGKIGQALTYPAVILAVCVLCILFVFNYIVPQMSGLFAGMADIPDYTAALLGLSDWFINYQWWLLFALLGLAVGLMAGMQKPQVRRQLGEFAIKIPVVRTMIVLVEQIRVNSALAMMAEAGIAVDKAMGLASASIGNASLRFGIEAAQQKVRKGAPLSEALRLSPLYPDFSISLLEVGEESGELGPVFEELAHRSRTQFESWVTKVTSVLEPLLILFMGGIVGTVVVVMLLSIVSVNDLGI